MAVRNISWNNTFQEYQHKTYAVFYTIIFIPGLISNVLALWILIAYTKETKKAVVFMINLATADLFQVLSLPLRIYYYLNKSWPFGQAACIICFYWKYVNMYASIVFLVCISVKRCWLITHPLHCSSLRRRQDRHLCLCLWLVVCVGCLPFPLLRSNPVYPHHCFSELPMKQLGVTTGLVLLAFAETAGFLVPLVVMITCTCLTAASLCKKSSVPQDAGEKRKALKMVLSCSGVFFLCFAPYHITFPLDFLAKTNVSMRSEILHAHCITLCLASLNSCLDPVMYYFTTTEFRRRLSSPELQGSVQRKTASKKPQPSC